jgi:RNA polymerase sigma-70 factor (ECF subfamily)
VKDRVDDDDDDDALMAACRIEGGTRAFAVLVSRHEARLRLFLARSLGDYVDVDAEARDLAQDVFVEVWQSRARYQARGRFVGWLLRIARSRATSRGRALAVRRLFSLRSAPTTTTTTLDPLAAVLRREEEARVRAALSALPRTTREAVTLRFTYGLEHKEIGAILDVNEGAVRVRVHRGLGALEAALRPVVDDDAPSVVPAFTARSLR